MIVLSVGFRLWESILDWIDCAFGLVGFKVDQIYENQVCENQVGDFDFMQQGVRFGW